MNKPFISVSKWASEQGLSFASILKMARKHKKTWLKIGDEYVVNDVIELENLLEEERDYQKEQTMKRRERAKAAAAARKLRESQNL